MDAVVIINVPDKVLVDRIAGQRVHLASGRSNHVKFAPPNVDGQDDITGEPLIQRNDDNEATLDYIISSSCTAPHTKRGNYGQPLRCNLDTRLYLLLLSPSWPARPFVESRQE